MYGAQVPDGVAVGLGGEVLHVPGAALLRVEEALELRAAVPRGERRDRADHVEDPERQQLRLDGLQAVSFRLGRPSVFIRALGLDSD